MVEEKLLMLRKKLKQSKPEFVRQEYDRRIKLEKKWRQPKGLHSKMRQKFGGRRKHPGSCYRVPKEVRGLSRKGLRMVHVNCFADFAKLKEGDCAIIGRVGTKLKLEIIKKLVEMKIPILNVRSPEEFVKKIEEEMLQKKEKKKAIAEKKQKSKEERLKKAEEKSAQKEKSAEEKKEEEAEEKRKVLEAKE